MVLIPSRELCKVVLTEDKVREKGERVSLCPVFTPFSLGKGGQQARQTDLILNLPVPPVTLYSYRYGM